MNTESRSSYLYGDIFSTAYDGLYANKDYSKECDLIEHLFSEYGKDKARSIVDLGCGTGTHAVMMATRGYNVTGIDASLTMLDQAKSKEKLLPQSVRNELTFINGDINDIELQAPVDGALMLFSVLGYAANNEKLATLLSHVRKMINPGGVFIFDFWYGPAVISHDPGSRVGRTPIPDGEIIRISNGEIDDIRQVCEISFEFWQVINDQITDRMIENHEMRYFFPREINMLLTSAGFRLGKLGTLDDFDSDPHKDDRNVFCVAIADGEMSTES